MDATVAAYLTTLKRCLDEVADQDVGAVAEVIREAARLGRDVYLCGNGGSASTASHVACDLARSAGDGGPRVRTHSLCDPVPLLTALANDVGYDAVFAGQLAGRLRPGDVLIAISASGESPNVLAAVRHAAAAGARTVALAGFGGGRLAALAERALVVSSRDYGPVEDTHLAVGHLISRLVGRRTAADR